MGVIMACQIYGAGDELTTSIAPAAAAGAWATGGLVAAGSADGEDILWVKLCNSMDLWDVLLDDGIAIARELLVWKEGRMKMISRAGRTRCRIKCRYNPL